MTGYLKKHFYIKPRDIELYALAFQHKSVAKTDESGFKLSNERLEFLGDTVIDTIVSEYLYEHYPRQSEGFLTRMRSRIVSRESLNRLGRKLNLLEHVKYKKVKRGTAHEHNKALVGNVLESLVGAMYLDLGYEKTKMALLKGVLNKYIDLKVVEETDTDYKSQLLIYCQSVQKKLSFKQINVANIEGSPYFTMGVEINGKIIAKATASSKRKAEQKASKIALEEITA